MDSGHQQLGEILVGKGAITNEALEKALRIQAQTGRRLGKILLEQGWIDEDTLTDILSTKLKIPKVELSPSMIDTAVIPTLPREFAEKHRVIPLFKVESDLTVAMADPTDIFAIDAIRELTRARIHVAIANESEVDAAIARFYSVDDSVLEVVKDIDEEDLSVDEAASPEIVSSADDPAVVRLVNLIICEAVKQGASDIHIEPDEGALNIRYRIDGVLRHVSSPPHTLQSMITARIKIMSDLNVSEKRVPQDGRIKIRVDKKSIDLRVSILPTIWGEKTVMRVLDKGAVSIGLDRMGFSRENLETWRSVITRPEGILLITGPTGSGKTSTLYAVLQEISSVEKNVITVEDPVEYNFPIINQVQVNEKAGLTFAAALRSILRQDPDIVMIGEMRDLETAEIGTRAALTGHLVLSTLHTNSAAGALTRLVDMGIQPFLVSSSTIAILAQRLIRRLCKKCKVGVPLDTVSPEIREMVVARGAELYRGEGCEECNHTGYKGRTGIHELIVMNDDIKRMVLEGKSTEEIHSVAVEMGMCDLRHDGLNRAFAGDTTVDEVFRVT